MTNQAPATARLGYLTSALLQNALLQAGADSQKLTKPAHEKPATSRLFNAWMIVSALLRLFIVGLLADKSAPTIDFLHA